MASKGKATSVRVYVRMRPWNKRELALGDLECPIVLRGQMLTIPEREKQFQFDYLFGPSATQEEVFAVVGKAVISDFMDGFNATQFVYGQTGSGKTWTMMGTDEQRGVVPRSAALIFELIAKKEEGWSYEIQASYLEIYMEKVNDLLDPEKTNLDLKENKKSGIYVAGLTQEPIASLEDVYDILRRGDKIRKVASTKMNAGSSRSHSVLTIYLSQTSPAGAKMSANLNLVDLAGSERIDKTGATGETLKQGTLINLSLTTLSQVISGLSKAAGGADKSVIPFRNSKLTRLLQTSLGGNSKSALSVHLSPHRDNLDESISTLEFGKRAKMIKTIASALVQKTVEQLEAELEALQKEFDALKQLFEKRSGGKLPEGLFGSLEEEEKGDDGGENGTGVTGEDGGEMIGEIGEGGGNDSGATGGGGGGGGKAGGRANFKLMGAPPELLEAEKKKVADLLEDKKKYKRKNEDLTTEIAFLEEKLMAEQIKSQQWKKDCEIKDLEVQTLNARIRALKQITEKKDYDPTSPQAKSDMEELSRIITQQNELLEREEEEFKNLTQENSELTEELTDKTRRLAVAELQVMRFEKIQESQAKTKNSARKKSRGSSTWETLLQSNESPSGLITSRSATADYEALRQGTILEKLGGLNPVPSEELKGGREGYLYEKVAKTENFAKKLFVLKDSFLFCYSSKDSSPSEPEYVVSVATSKVGSCPKQGNQEFCFMVLSGQFFTVLAATTESEKNVWIKDIENSKFVTHSTLLNLVYFNQRVLGTITDLKAQAEIGAKISNAVFSFLGDAEYAHVIPCAGGMEGFLFSKGIENPTQEKFQEKKEETEESAENQNQNQTDSNQEASGVKPELKWRDLYFIISSSFLFVYDFQVSELVTKPVGILHLHDKVDIIKSQEEELEDSGEGKSKSLFYFSLSVSGKNRSSITMAAQSSEERDRWVQALQVAKLVNVRNVMLASLYRERIAVKASINPKGQDTDILGKLLGPGCMQPYDEKGKPIFRNPEGKSVGKDLNEIPLNQEKFSSQRNQLDFFNRPLPSGAVPMFATSPVEPIGVGIDGKHYAYPSGRVLALTDPHYDAKGVQIAEEVVENADAIVPSLKIASIVGSAILNPNKYAVYDAFGRVLKKSRDGHYITAEGEILGKSASLFDACGNTVPYPNQNKQGEIVKVEIVYYNHLGEPITIGKVSIETGNTTLALLHSTIKGNISTCSPNQKITSIVFLINGVPVSDSECESRVVSDIPLPVVVNCRDMEGKRMKFEGKAFQVDIDHAGAEKAAIEEMNAEFSRQISKYKRKK